MQNKEDGYKVSHKLYLCGICLRIQTSNVAFTPLWIMSQG